MKENNISRYIQINDAVLLEYIINNNYVNDNMENDDITSSNFLTADTKPIIFNIKGKDSFNRLMVECDNAGSNNLIDMTAIPMDKECSNWVKYTSNNLSEIINNIAKNCISDINGKYFYQISEGLTNIPYDTVRLHILSGYSFVDISGFLLRIKTKNNKGEDIYLANWFFERDTNLYNYEKMMIINDRVYDKYVDLKIPSMKALKTYSYNGEDYKDGQEILDILDIQNGSLTDIELIYSSVDKSNISKIYDENIPNRKEIGFSFTLDNEIKISIPYDSPADSFNIYLEESSDGDYISFCGTWDDNPLSFSTISKFGNQIKISSTNNDNYDLESLYYADTGWKSNWIINHELVTSAFKMPTDDSGKDYPELITRENYTTTQDFIQNVNEKVIFNYKPIIQNNLYNSRIDFITFDYTCKLINRYNGEQIVRKGSLTTYNVNRYIQGLSKISVKQITPYSVFNRLENITEQFTTNNITPKTKFTKIFYDISNINVELTDTNSTYYVPEENYVLNIYKFDHNYKMKFSAFDNESQGYKHINLNDMSSYALRFIDANDKVIEIPCTYSNNMNLTLGELEFKISTNNSQKMFNVPDNKKIISIIVKNLDGSISTLFECKYTFDWHK